ncbi:MAG: hypothetical protein NUV67_03025 [archaeon]|nr:hypothetical protein [archaeon]
MVWDILVAAMSLDFGALLDIALGNLLWIFMFFAVSFFFFEGRRPIRAFLHVAFAAMFFAVLMPFAGWAEYTGAFLMVYYLVDFSILKFAESTPALAGKLVLVEEFNFFSSIIVFNLFM